MALLSVIVPCYKEEENVKYFYEELMKNKPFLATMGIAFLFYFVYNLPNATINVWLLEDVKVSYTLINGINMLKEVFEKEECCCCCEEQNADLSVKTML